VQLLQKRGEELDLRHILIKPKINDQDLNEARAYLDSLRQEILLDKIPFDQAAFELSEDEDTRFNNGLLINPQSGDSKWDISQIDRSLFYAIEEMSPGEISTPALLRTPDGKEAFRIIRLLEKTEPHRANLKDDYSRLQMMATMDKKQKVIEDWVKEKVKETAVRISQELVDCSFNYNWSNTDEL
jgi:peptidyl-prolyl cis-trans isomerase SurA